MPAHVYLTELADAFDWVTAGEAFDAAAYVSRETGRIFCDAGDVDLDLDEELPEDVEDEMLYARVPDKRDLDLGRRLVFRFIEAHAPDACDEVRSYFSRQGAYARFKDLLDRRNLLHDWHAYEEQARDAALREWATTERLDLVEGRREGG